MSKRNIIFGIVFFVAAGSFLQAKDLPTLKTDTVTLTIQLQHDVVVPGGESVLAVRFNMAEDWHFYASPETAPGEMNLQVNASSQAKINFGKPIFPPGVPYFDKSLGIKLDVFSNDFAVYIPFTVNEEQPEGAVKIQVKIEGAVCSDIQCRVPDYEPLDIELRIAQDASAVQTNFVLPSPDSFLPVSSVEILSRTLSYSLWYALGLALLAGLSLNIMPCVWPVLPLIVLRIVGQAEDQKKKKITMGLLFCLGILLFFACLAAVNIVLHIVYGTALQWGDQLRNPIFVTVLTMVLVVLALFMFDVFTIVLPGSLSGKTASAKGYSGTVGMGFLAAVLSTPCSFGILAAAFAWAQSQPLVPATIAIMFIGIGMALPYLILTLIPGFIEKLPKPGKWMDIFKKAVGFILLGIAVWMITVIPQEIRAGAMYFAVILSFCGWMWGGWVGFGSKTSSKIIIRTIAVLLAVIAGFYLLSKPKQLIAWQSYDSGLIQKSLTDNKPVLIKFTADWCLSCKAVEKLVYEREDVARIIKDKNAVAIKADTTARDYPATIALKEIYNEPGVPVSILLLPEGRGEKRWRDKTFGDELIKALEEF